LQGLLVDIEQATRRVSPFQQVLTCHTGFYPRFDAVWGHYARAYE
jgi:hypothetical protein